MSEGDGMGSRAEVTPHLPPRLTLRSILGRKVGKEETCLKGETKGSLRLFLLLLSEISLCRLVECL